MNFFFSILITILLYSCSFDQKSGIWKNENQISKKDSKIFEEFKNISFIQNQYKEIVKLDKNFQLNINKPVTNISWEDEYFSNNNHLANFSYNNSNQLIFNSKKTTRHQISENIFFKKNKLITSDKKGNVIVFSIEDDKNLVKFNFYQNKYKKIDKILNLIIDENKIYISDNLGFIYAYNYNENKIIWAKNYKIPFRSNIKIYQNKIILANQNNTLFFINKNNGEILRKIPTEDSSVKNKFKNNISLYENKIKFLNTYGSLYSLDVDTMRIRWFINLNKSLDINPSNLFMSNQLVIYNNKIFVPTQNNLYILDFITGSTIFKHKFTSKYRPLIFKNVLYTIDNNFLIASDINTGKIIFSYNINQKISDYLNIKRKSVDIKNFMFADNKIFVFLKNSYLIQFAASGEILTVYKMPKKINSNPIFIEDKIIFMNNKNKINIIN